MIINGGSRSGAKSLATHLLNRTKNERVSVLEVRGCLSTDLRGALIEMEESAQATRCQRALYHANIDPDRSVTMTPPQWQRCIEALEKKLGLEDHPRAVVMHQKHGREHIHIVWNRIDLETMRAVRDSHNYRKHEMVARDLEREFGHERVQGAHVEREGQERPERTPPKWVMQQGERLKLDPRQVKEQVRKLWQTSDSGRSFTAALENQGLMLAQGDRRDFMVIDPSAGGHSLGRCVGVKATALRARMADVDRATLPTFEQAVTTMRARQATQQREAVGKEFDAAADAALKPSPKAERKPEIEAAPPSLPPPAEKKLDETSLDIQAAYNLNDSARAFAEFLNERGIYLAAVTAKEAQRDATYRVGEIVAINQQGQVYALDRDTTGDDPVKVEKFLSGLDRKRLGGIAATQEEINLRAQQFIAITQVGVLHRPELEKKVEPPSLPSPEPAPVRERINWRRYIADAGYRHEIQRQQEKEKPAPDRDRGRGGWER